MPKRQKGYHCDRKKNKRGNASKGGKGKGPPVDGPPVDDPSVDDPPVDDPPVDDPPVDDPPVDDPPVNGTQTESSLSTAETLVQSDLGDGEDFTETILQTEDAIDTDSETDIDPTDADVEEGCISRNKQVAAAGGQMSGNGTRPNEEATRQSNEEAGTRPNEEAGTRPNEEAGRSSTGPGPPAVAVQPTNDPTGSSGDLANGIDATDDMPIHCDQKPEQTVQDADVKVSESTVKVASAAGNMSGNGTRPKRPSPVPSANADVEEYGISHTEQEAAAGAQMSVSGMRSNEEAARSSIRPVPSAGSGTSGESPKLDLATFKQHLNIGFLVISMDRVTELLIKMLAESISSKPEWKKVLTELIENWQSPLQAIQTQEKTNLQRATKRVIKVPYASLWSDVWAMANGTKDVVDGHTSNIFLNVFGLTFRYMLDHNQQGKLDDSLRQAITEADQTEIHTIPKVRAQKARIVEYLKQEEKRRLAFRQVLIEEVIRTAKWFLGELHSSVETFLPNKEIDESDALSKKKTKFYLVQSMIIIRNDVVHEKSGFVDKEREHFEDDYKAFIEGINLLTYRPASTHAAQREKYLEPIRDVERFHKVGEENVRLRDDLQKKSKESSDWSDKVTELNGIITYQNSEIGQLRQENLQLSAKANYQEQAIQKLHKKLEELEGEKK